MMTLAKTSTEAALGLRLNRLEREIRQIKAGTNDLQVAVADLEDKMSNLDRLIETLQQTRQN